MNAPELRCISVESNGDITLNWIPAADPGTQFQKYVLYGSVNNLPFAAVDSMPNRLQNVYTIVGANWGNPFTNYKFYMTTKYNDGGGVKESAPSVTLTPINANLTVSGNISGNLSWNNIANPALTSSGPKYKVNRRFISNPPSWTNDVAEPPIGTESFNDNVARCDDSVFYQVELPDQSGCVSKSNVVSAQLRSGAGPIPWPLSRVSVKRGRGYTELFWDPHPNGAVTRYIIIYDDASGTSKFIDTVSASTLSYKDFDFNHSAHLAPQCYRIAALDSCNNTQGGGDIIHCTMHLTRDFDPCLGEVYLNWTPYKGWDCVSAYNIYLALDDDSNYTQVGTVSGEDTSFTVKNVSALNVYKFYIEAISCDGRLVSFSNDLGTKFNIPNKTEYIRLRSASVLNSETVQLNLMIDKKAPLKRIDYYRGLSEEGPFMKVDTFVPTGVDSLQKIIDSVSTADQLNYAYYLVVIDECDQEIVVSNIKKTMLLTGESRKYDFENDLTWTRNINRDTSIEDGLEELYEVYKGLNGSYLPNYIRRTNHTNNKWTDEFSQDIYATDDICYYVRLVQPPGILYPFPDTSYSNTLCFKYEPDIFIANTFSPNQDGLNEVWKPKVTFVIPLENYHFEVFDRWGKLMFETTDPQVGWNGKNNDVLSPVGQYVYHFKAITVHGSTIERRGYFNLTR